MQLKYSMQRAALVVGVLALVSITAVARRTDQKSASRARDFSRRTRQATAYSNVPTRRADFFLAIVTTSIVGSRPKRTTATTATHNSISAAHRLASSPISTKSLVQQ